MEKNIRACIAAIIAAGATLCADAYASILVERKTSASGREIVAHNEDSRSGAFSRYAFADVSLVVGLADRCSESSSVGNYANALYAVGHTPLMIPHTENRQAVARALGKVDVLLLCGGEDVATFRYGETCTNACMPNLVRDAWEWMLLDEAVKRRLPVVGVCRGLQVINVYFGGSLYQDLVTGFPGAITHSGGKVSTMHPVLFERDSRIGRILGVDEKSFTSWHHQGVKRLAPGFKVAARAPDGFVEAIESENYPAAGVQFHPELTYASEGDIQALAPFRAILEWAGAPRPEKGKSLPLERRRNEAEK